MRVSTAYSLRIEASPVSEVKKNVQVEDKVTDEASADHPRLLTQTVISGLKWTLGAQLLKQGSQFLITVSLAGFLAPRNIGLLTMVAIFSGFASLFNNLENR